MVLIILNLHTSALESRLWARKTWTVEKYSSKPSHVWALTGVDPKVRMDGNLQHFELDVIPKCSLLWGEALLVDPWELRCDHGLFFCAKISQTSLTVCSLNINNSKWKKYT